MMVTLHQLECFDAVVSEGKFQAAAQKLRRSQPSISAAVKNLEDQLGLTLLDRSGYRVALTEAGRSFHQRARFSARSARPQKSCRAARARRGKRAQCRHRRRMSPAADLGAAASLLRRLPGRAAPLAFR